MLESFQCSISNQISNLGWNFPTSLFQISFWTVKLKSFQLLVFPISVSNYTYPDCCTLICHPFSKVPPPKNADIIKIYIKRAYSGLVSYSENTFFDGFDKNSLKILISYGNTLCGFEIKCSRIRSVGAEYSTLPRRIQFWPNPRPNRGHNWPCDF